MCLNEAHPRVFVLEKFIANKKSAYFLYFICISPKKNYLCSEIDDFCSISLRVSEMLGEAVVLDVGTKGFVDNCNEMGKWAGIGNQRMLADHLLYYPR